MSTAEVVLAGLTILAIIAGPFVGVHVQKRLDDQRSRSERRTNIFQTLMATRGAQASPQHVYALNSIDIEFKGVKRVEEAWHDYLDHLIHPVHPPDPNLQAAWDATAGDLFANLLYEMSGSLGYRFERNYLRRGVYRPQSHLWDEELWKVMRWGLYNLFSGQDALPVRVVGEPPQHPTVNGGEDAEPEATDDGGVNGGAR